jgi:hypothetical protein
MTADSLEDALFAASGIAGYAMATSTLVRLYQNGVLGAQEVVSVIEDALSGLDKIHARKPGIELHVARELLETSLEEWRSRL